MPPGGDTIDLTSRRVFLKNTGMLFVSIAVAGRIRGIKPLFSVKESKMLMGSTWNITAIGTDPSIIYSAVKEAYQVVDRLERLMTTFDPESEISKLNNIGKGHLSQECETLLKNALRFSEITKGVFDVTLGDFKSLKIEPGYARFLKKGMRMDLGGIGIGFAVDRAIDVLKTYGLEGAIVDGGGEVRAFGKKEEDLSWRVGIRDPQNPEEFIEVIDLPDRAVSTSNNTLRTHIIDPRTGRYPTGLLSATIIADNALRADVFSTAAFILGAKEGLKFIENTPGLEGLLITVEGRFLRTKGFSKALK